MASSVEQALWKIVSDDSGVSALVGSRIYRGMASQDETRPYIVIRVISQDVEVDLEEITENIEFTARIYCYDEYVDGVNSLVEAVKVAIDGITVTEGGASVEPSHNIRVEMNEDVTFTASAVVEADFFATV